MNLDVSWRLSWDGVVWTAADLTADEVASLQVLLEDGWSSLDPRRTPVHLLNHLAVHLAAVTEFDYGVWTERLKLSTLPELLAALAPVEVPADSPSPVSPAMAVA